MIKSRSHCVFQGRKLLTVCLWRRIKEDMGVNNRAFSTTAHSRYHFLNIIKRKMWLAGMSIQKSGLMTHSTVDFWSETLEKVTIYFFLNNSSSFAGKLAIPHWKKCFTHYFYVPHWWGTVAGWRRLRSHADSSTPRRDGRTWNVLCQGTNSTNHRRYVSPELLVVSVRRQPYVHEVRPRSLKVTRAFLQMIQGSMRVSHGFPAPEENGISAVTFLWSNNNTASTHSSPTTRT